MKAKGHAKKRIEESLDRYDEPVYYPKAPKALPGRKPLGVAIAEVDEATGGYPAYYMINCAHPRHFTGEVKGGAPWVGRIGGLRANASAKSHAELDASPEIDIGDIAELAEDHSELLPSLPNLQLIGGCCGTDHRHIAAICARCLS